MIFVGLFFLIVLIALALNLHNNSNLNKIEEFLIKENCKELVYSKGSYKALCDDGFKEIKNSFSVDIEKNSIEIKYKDMQNLKITNMKILINDDYLIEFKNKSDLDSFYEKLEKKVRM